MFSGIWGTRCHADAQQFTAILAAEINQKVARSDALTCAPSHFRTGISRPISPLRIADLGLFTSRIA